ncbi:MAG: hypothetical protein HGA27_07570 [Peptococcaceae bacterium]|nr:hypothetical protein [Peptococcaceae bacterium]
MQELVSVLIEIRDQLFELNNKIDNLTSSGTENISELVNAIENIKGDSGRNLTDIYSKLGSISTTLHMIG